MQIFAKALFRRQSLPNIWRPGSALHKTKFLRNPILYYKFPKMGYELHYKARIFSTYFKVITFSDIFCARRPIIFDSDIILWQLFTFLMSAYSLNSVCKSLAGSQPHYKAFAAALSSCWLNVGYSFKESFADLWLAVDQDLVSIFLQTVCIHYELSKWHFAIKCLFPLIELQIAFSVIQSSSQLS